MVLLAARGQCQRSGAMLGATPMAGHTNRHKTLIILKSDFLKNMDFWFSRTFPKKRKYSVIVGLLCIINCYFEYRIRILCIWLYMRTWFKMIFWDFFRKNSKNVSKKFKKCPRSVNNFRTDNFARYCFGILVLILNYLYDFNIM